MTTMLLALKNAQLAVPLNKRIWLWLKDHPDKTCPELEKALGESRSGHVSNALHDLICRGMISKRGVAPRSHPTRRRGRQLINAYSALGAEFDLLPKRRTDLPEVIAKHAASTPVPHAPPAPEKPVGKFAIDIENMTLSEAHALYLKLQEFFK